MTTRPSDATRRWRAVLGTVAFVLVLVACGRLTEASSGREKNAIGVDGGGDPGQSVPGSTGDPGAPPDDGDGTGTICIETTAGGDNPEDPVVGCADGGDDPAPHTSTPVTPRPGMADLYPIGWDRVDVADDDRTLTIHFWSGIEPCYVLDHVDVAYAGDTITITLYEGHDPQGEAVACIEIAMAKSVTIQLDEPLGGRALVDGAEPGGEE
jgi:hypothetical protein